LEPKGIIHVDAGAVAALGRGKSLLPVGVVRVEGAFARGDAVIIRGPDGAEVGRGLVAYDRDDAARLVGQNSERIEAILGYRGRSEMIHRDDLALGSE
jgi:glutamate 5-kinase